MTKYLWRAVLIEASYEDIKSPYGEEYNTSAHPNAVSGTRFGRNDDFDVFAAGKMIRLSVP